MSAHMSGAVAAVYVNGRPAPWITDITIVRDHPRQCAGITHPLQVVDRAERAAREWAPC